MTTEESQHRAVTIGDEVTAMHSRAELAGAMEEVDTSDHAHENWPDRFFGRVVDSLLSKTSNRGGRVGDAMTHVIGARELFNCALPLIQAVAKDPHAADTL